MLKNDRDCDSGVTAMMTDGATKSFSRAIVVRRRPLFDGQFLFIGGIEGVMRLQFRDPRVPHVAEHLP
jgi:hypothetical protein